MIRGNLPVLLIAWTASAAGCATTPIFTADGDEAQLRSRLVEQASFEHGCSPERIVLIRQDAGTTFDLDICGSVRRYRCDWSCEDKTSAFPPEVLPRPVQPSGGTVHVTAPPPEHQSGPFKCEKSADCTAGGICYLNLCRRG